MDKETFQHFRTLIEGQCGIHLADEKHQLLANRIQKRMRSLSLSDHRQYLEIVESDLNGQELMRLLDVVSTNTTYFYREEKHFEIFGKMLEDMRATTRQEIKVWCAASSSGEEPYTLAMTVAEHYKGKAPVKILATDISTKVLAHAVAGRYEEVQLDKLPDRYIEKYFVQQEEGGRNYYHVIPELAQAVSFKRLNLAEHPLPLRGDLDFIFCRNVMIYFQIELRQKLISEFTRLLKPGGFLFLSHSENLLGITHTLKNYATAVYQKGEP